MYFRMEGLPNYQPRAYPRLDHAEFIEVDEEDLDTSNLHARTLSPSERHALLSDRPSWTCSSSPPLDAEALFQDLARLSPSVAKSFSPRPATTDGLTFRLINDAYHEEKEQGYIAMSYCWRKVGRDVPTKEVSPVGDLPFGWVKTVERFPLPMGDAMFQAVLRERKVGEGIWFDQVCTAC